MSARYANLIPAGRLLARVRSRRSRRWATVCIAYGLLLLAAYGVCYAVLGGRDQGLTAELNATSGRIRHSGIAIASISNRLARVRAELDANRAVGNQPDWSVLLAMLSGSLQEDIFLRSCTLYPADSGGGQSPRAAELREKSDFLPAGQRPYKFVLGGYGRSHMAVSQFALRLENQPLFDEVRVLKTSREPLLANSAIAFKLECSLGKDPRTKSR